MKQKDGRTLSFKYNIQGQLALFKCMWGTYLKSSQTMYIYAPVGQMHQSAIVGKTTPTVASCVCAREQIVTLEFTLFVCYLLVSLPRHLFA